MYTYLEHINECFNHHIEGTTSNKGQSNI